MVNLYLCTRFLRYLEEQQIASSRIYIARATKTMLCALHKYCILMILEKSKKCIKLKFFTTI
ncbi:hypothetical protein NUACC26_074180 [Scytonema sp. NUACC26]